MFEYFFPRAGIIFVVICTTLQMQVNASVGGTRGIMLPVSASIGYRLNMSDLYFRLCHSKLSGAYWGFGWENVSFF